MTKTVLLLFGGESTEHEISVVSARNVYQAIDRSTYNVVLGYIDKSGAWWQVEDIVEETPATAKALLPNLGRGSFLVEDTELTVDVILPILHGPNGEDGSVQALAQLLHIPIVGCDMTASAVAMSKRRAKQIAQSAGITVVPYQVHHESDAMPDFETLRTTLGEVLFIKPDGAGSSVGVSRVVDQAGLEAALQKAHLHGAFALIEVGLDHPRELEVAVLGNYPDIRTSAVAEIRPNGEFYSYESKYDSTSTSEVIVPAEIPQDLREHIRSQAQVIYELIGCSGLARVDFFVDGDKLYFNEANTIPGFTNISVYPKAWAHEGIGYSDLIGRLIELAR